MNIVNLKLARGIIGALVASAMGFGAMQVLATPAQAASVAWWCTADEERWCDEYCAYYGGDGRCSNFGVLHCECVYH